MSIKKWPDPNCAGPHKAGERVLKWQHTKECKDSMPSRFRKKGEIDLPDLEDASIVERARAVGAL